MASNFVNSPLVLAQRFTFANYGIAGAPGHCPPLRLTTIDFWDGAYIECLLALHGPKFPRPIQFSYSAYMASPWLTYSPHMPPSRDAENSHTLAVPSELMVSDASLMSVDSAKSQALGRVGRNSSVSSIPPFNSTNRTHTEVTRKSAPILVSTTSFGFEFREAGISTRTSVDKQHTSALLQAPHSPMSNNGKQYAPTSENADIAATHLAGPISPTHKHAGPQSSLSSSTFEQDVLASFPTKNTHAVAPISAADNNVTPPPPPPDSTTTPQAITTGDVSAVDSPNLSITKTPTIKLPVTQSPELGRDKPERQRPQRLSTGGSTGSTGSSGIVRSRYAEMVFEDVPRAHNLLSGLFTWILLAGFVVLPGTFASLESNSTTAGEFNKVLHSIHHVSLCVHFLSTSVYSSDVLSRLSIAFGCCAIGALGMLIFWWRWAHNYVWLLNSIFVPGMLNGLSGVVSTIAGIYGSQNGQYNSSSIATLAVTGGCTIICGFITLIYSHWKLGRVKRRHDDEMVQMKNNNLEVMGEVQYF